MVRKLTKINNLKSAAEKIRSKTVNYFTYLFKTYSFMIKPLIILSVIYLISISAVIRADFNYCDDMGRVYKGYCDWTFFGRYVSVYLSALVHGDWYLTDISPLPQFLAACISALSSVFVIYLITGKRKFSFWNYISVIPMVLSPYFLQCLSYKYDSPYMALSVLAGVFPFLFLKRGSIAFFAASVIGNLVMCMTYQASSGIYPLIAVILCFIMWNKGEKFKNIIKFIAVSAGAYSVSLIFFRLFIMNRVENTYVDISVPSSVNLISQTFANFQKYYTLIYTDLKKPWLLLIVLIIIAFIYAAVRDSSRKKLFALPVSVITVAFMCILFLGVYPLLTEPLFNPRAMYGIGVAIALLAVYISAAKRVYPAKLICFALSWLFISFAFTYGNALAEQQRYTDLRVSEVVYDLSELETVNTDEIKTIQLSGDIGLSPIIDNMPQDYQMLNRLVPTTFGDASDNWGKFYFYHFFDLRNVKTLKEMDNDIPVDLTTFDLPVLDDTMYHTIKGNEKYILIELK